MLSSLARAIVAELRSRRTSDVVVVVVVVEWPFQAKETD
jgi:hypothetical protein